MADRYSPTIQLRRLGRELRRARLAAGLSAEEVHEQLEISLAKLNKIENGRVECRAMDIIALMTRYGATERIKELSDIRALARSPMWWQDYGVTLGAYVDFEAEASLIRSHDPMLIPGLLQTPDYARSVVRALNQHFEPETIEQEVEVRIKRQDRLTGDTGPRLWAILGEAAIRTEIGGPGKMAAQLRHLAELVDHPKVTVQVLPFGTGEHSGLEGPFALLEYEDPEDPTLLYLERVGGATWGDRPDVVARASMAHEHLLAAAESVNDSATAIRHAAAAMERSS